MIAVYKHEVRSAYNNLTVYLFSAALLCFVGLGAMYYNIQASVANFEYVLSFVSIGLVVIIPVLTMRSFAEERKQKTDQLLYSLPLKTWQIVVGKYLSLVTMFFVPMAIICLYPYVFSLYGDVYLPGAYGALAAFFALGAALIALGMFLSSLTDNQGFAAGIAIVLFLLNYYSVTLAEQVSTTALGSAAALGVGGGLVLLDVVGYNQALEKEETLPTVHCYARVDASRIVYEIPQSTYDKLTAADYNTLRHQKLFTTEFASVTAIDVTLAGERYRLTYTPPEQEDQEGTWHYGDKTFAPYTLRTALCSMDAQEFTAFTLTLYRHNGTTCLATIDGTPTAYVTRTQTVDLIEAINQIILDG